MLFKLVPFLISLFIFGLSPIQSQTVSFTSNNRLIFGTHEERTASMGAGDIDNDGDIDIILANGRHWPGQNRIFINNGMGKYSVSKELGDEKSTSYSTELGDFDNDGDLDIAVGNDMAPNNLFINDGEGNFSRAGTFGELYAPTRNIVVADIDNDGDQDILITNRGRTNEICINNGHGQFSESVNFGKSDDSTIDVEIADIDKDGDNDLILANRDEQQNYIYLNNGRLGFLKSIPYGSGTDNTRSVAVADINNDGFLDIATANINEPNRIYFGDKTSSYSKSIVFDTSSNNTSSITITDFNFDGQDDIVVGNFRKPNYVFLNSNNGSDWESIELSKKHTNTYDVICADINNDGLPDIVESNSDDLNRYYINQYVDPSLENVINKGDFLIYRRQSMIGKETYNIKTTHDKFIVESLIGENERGRVSGVITELHTDKNDFSPLYYNSIRIAGGDTTNILSVNVHDDKTVVHEEYFDPVNHPTPQHFFPLHSNIPAGAEVMLYHYYFNQKNLSGGLPTLPRGNLTITHTDKDTVQIRGKEVVLDRYVVEGINWGGRTIWLDEDKNLVAIVKANTQIREIVRRGYESALSTFIEGNVEEQMRQLSNYTKNQKVEQPSIIAIVGGDVFDGIHDRTSKNQVIIIEDGRISEIGNKGKIKIPSNATVIDANGKTLIPGLWDMHAHSNQVQWAPAYLAGGVTTIRDNGNEIEFATAFRDGIAKNGMLGPDILLAGMTDGPGKKGNGAIRATTEEEAREVVEMYINKGYKQIKIYNSIEPDILKVLTEEAHKRGVTATGHIPTPVGTVWKAVELGMDMFSHDRAITSLLFPDVEKKDFGKLDINFDSISTEQIDKATKFLLENEIVLDPTMNLRIIMSLQKGNPLKSIEPFAPRIAYELWEGKRHRSGITPKASAKMKLQYEKFLEVIGAFYRAGVPIVAGTDNFVPVFSLYLELEAYQKYANLSPFEVLQTATIIPARVMKLDKQTGSIEVGKEADITILDKNPLEDISNIRTVTAVLTNGNYYNSNELWKEADFAPRDK